ncbi:MAG: sugar phosphate isomerase/epimerase [Chitinophagaceae bacterium]|nr:sugar phosphate isomerase/epimerase [Chitinophagaceae bacterium]
MNIVKPWFNISLAQWSLNKTLFANKITNLDFPAVSKKQFGIDTVEYVNLFFKDKAEDTGYLDELLKRCNDNGVKNHLVMIDAEGALAEPAEADRKVAVKNHFKWVDAAKYLGCSSIRVNIFGNGTPGDLKKAAIASLCELSEYAAKKDINILIENHGGYTSDAQWMVDVLEGVNKPNVGSLPDFGNFCIRSENGLTWGNTCFEEYDKYKGVKELMPFAKGVSAKVMEFTDSGECKETDYARMMNIVKESGFKGYVGIESSVSRMEDEADGIVKTKALVEKYA